MSSHLVNAARASAGSSASLLAASGMAAAAGPKVGSVCAVGAAPAAFPLQQQQRFAARSFASASGFELLDKYPEVAEKLQLKAQNPGAYWGEWGGSGEVFKAVNPATGNILAEVQGGTVDEYAKCIEGLNEAQKAWQALPMPVRGQIVYQLGQRLRECKEELGMLISLEMGKIKSEGLGEVQEAIDICDLAVGLSRTINGQVLPSERPGHFMMENWNPLKGHLGIISAFNFPCAVFFWNAALSLVCGNTQVWKGADTSGLVTVACSRILADVLSEAGHPKVAAMIQGSGKTIGEAMVADPQVELVSFTGSTAVGRRVNEVIASRFGKRILELGGNNAMIVMDDANLDLAVPAALFAAAGTCGQRCTSLRRLYIHEEVYDEFLDRLKRGYSNIRIGDPLDPKTLVGPLHNSAAVDAFRTTLEKAQAQGGRIAWGGKVLSQSQQPGDGVGNFVEPAVVEMTHSTDPESVVQHEVFVPILYVMKFASLPEAIAANNSVKQGLSSSLFTQNLSNMLHFHGPSGSDCGIVNVNVGTSGAEIGGAFGGEKETGGGRESGSDSWKQYMRRSTCTINYSGGLALAQGVKFE